MSSRPFTLPVNLLNAGDLSGDLTSKPLIVEMESLVSFSITWSGSSPVGTLTVEVSDDYSLNATGGIKNAGTWNTLPTSPASLAVSGGAGHDFFNLANIAAYAIRVKYVHTSGTGTLTVIGTAKVA